MKTRYFNLIGVKEGLSHRKERSYPKEICQRAKEERMVKGAWIVWGEVDRGGGEGPSVSLNALRREAL